MSKLKNYTSGIPSSTSMGRIEQLLVQAGATDFNKSYGPDKTCSAIKFSMNINNQVVHFKLPANKEACFNALWSEVKNPGRANRQAYVEQADRTAWKILVDWVEVQLSMIQLEQAKPLQIFLPYVYDPKTDKTFYDLIEHNPKLLPGGS